MAKKASTEVAAQSSIPDMTEARLISWSVRGMGPIELAQIRADGRPVVKIAGPNASGKTTLLRSLVNALKDGKAQPERPVKEGHEEGEVNVDLGPIRIRQIVQKDRSMALKVTRADGTTIPGARAVLDDLTRGGFCLDALDILHKKPDEALEMVKRGLGIDTTSIDQDRTKVYDERTNVNRRVKDLDGLLAQSPIDPGSPTAEVDMAASIAEVQKAMESQAAIATAKNMIQSRKDGLVAHQREFSAIQKRIQELEAQADGQLQKVEAAKEQIKEAEAKLAGAESAAVDPEPIRQRIQKAEEINRQVRKRQEIDAKTNERMKHQIESDRLTKRIGEIDGQREALIASKAAALVDMGAKLTPTGIELLGVPFAQASEAQRIEFGIALGLASNPAIRILTVRNGSLLDQKHMELLEKMAEKHRATVVVEIVTDGDAIEGGILIVNGEVQG